MMGIYGVMAWRGFGGVVRRMGAGGREERGAMGG